MFSSQHIVVNDNLHVEEGSLLLEIIVKSQPALHSVMVVGLYPKPSP